MGVLFLPVEILLRDEFVHFLHSRKAFKNK